MVSIDSPRGHCFHKNLDEHDALAHPQHIERLLELIIPTRHLIAHDVKQEGAKNKSELLHHTVNPLTGVY